MQPLAWKEFPERHTSAHISTGTRVPSNANILFFSPIKTETETSTLYGIANEAIVRLLLTLSRKGGESNQVIRENKVLYFR